jgi:CheY-like chemotaxis protein
MQNVPSIFYTDDDIDDQTLFREVIADLGNTYELHFQNNGDELLSKLENPPPRPVVIFLDLNMPGKNGLQVLEEMRSSEEYKNYPVIIFTTSDDAELIDATRKLGANLFITKPLSFKAFKKAVNFSLSLDWKTFKAEKHNFVYSYN